jgi:hypothetical protein
MTRTAHGPGAGGPGDDLEQQLTALLAERAALAPEAAAVRRSADAARRVRRQRARRAGAGAALGLVGLAAVALPQLDGLPRALRTPSTAETTTAPSQPGRTVPTVPWTLPQDGTSPLAADPPAEPALPWDQDDVDAFTGAGYTYADAVTLADLWQHPGDAVYAKVTGGAQLRDGRTLPIAAGSAPALVGDDDAWRAFTSAGHDVDDALALAQLWQAPSGYGAALRAGRDLASGTPLPPLPPAAERTTQDDRARQAWAAAGYDEQDAQQLAGLWALQSPVQAEVAGGHNLLTGQPVPVRP